MTGAPVPAGADAVVMVERSREAGKGSVELLEKPRKWQNIRFKGENIKKGAVVVRKGALLRPVETAILASVGKTSVRVMKKPSVAVLSTGDEIVEPGLKPPAGKLRNSNGPLLTALLARAGLPALYLGIAKDTKRSLRAKINKGLDADVLLLSGGVSMGDRDLVPEVLGELGVRKVFHTMAVRPGKPVFFGTHGRRLVFGVPGHPVSNFICFHESITPALHALAGRTWRPPYREALLAADFRKKRNLRYCAPALTAEKEGRLVTTPLAGYKGSSDIAELHRANSHAILDRGTDVVKKGTAVKVSIWR